MNAMRYLVLPIAVLFVISVTKVQAADSTSTQIATTETTETEENATGIWSFSASSYTYFVPDDQNYVSAIFTADRNWLHLEGRYNYEDIHTGSAWIGSNFSFGNEFVCEVIPMFGGVFGNLNGVAPGWELSVSYAKVEFYSENEYLFDLEDSSGNFYYNWTELTYSPVDWLHVGLVIQRTKAYQTDLDVQRGLLAGFSHKMLDVTVYIFNPGWDKPTVSVAASLNF
jgi:hypothetical protein